MESDYLLRTLQPYLVFNTPQFQQLILAKYGISHFYNYSLDTKNTIISVPTGCVDLIFKTHDNKIEAKLYGSFTQYKQNIPVLHEACFCVRFLPGVIPSSFHISLKDLFNNERALSQVMPTDSLYESLLSAHSFDAQITCFLTHYLSEYKEEETISDTQHIVFHAMLSSLCKNNGNLRINTLEKIIGYSSRYMNTIFREQMGLSAKAFSTIVKFQNILDRLSYDTHSSLSAIAVEYGYYDQSHFIHDFRKNAGTTPLQFRKMVKERGYANHLLTV